MIGIRGDRFRRQTLDAIEVLSLVGFHGLTIRREGGIVPEALGVRGGCHAGNRSDSEEDGRG